MIKIYLIKIVVILFQEQKLVIKSFFFIEMNKKSAKYYKLRFLIIQKTDIIYFHPYLF